MDFVAFRYLLLVLLSLLETTWSERDLLESFRPMPNNPSELNEFLANVLDHRGDFNFVREQAKRLQKIKKDTAFEEAPYVDPLAELDLDNDFSSNYKIENKRNIHNYRNAHNRRRKSEWKTSHRFKRAPNSEILIEVEGENGNIPVPGEKYPNFKKQKKETFEDDLVRPVHKTAKHLKGRQMQKHEDENLLYVDLGESTNNKDKYDEKRRFAWIPEKQQNYYSDQFQPRNYYPPRNDYRNFQNPPNDNLDYFNPKSHNSIEDEVQFERAQSFEIEPRNQMLFNENPNSPQGNDLYSVDEGRSDSIEPFYPQFENQIQRGQALESQPMRIHDNLNVLPQQYNYQPPQQAVLKVVDSNNKEIERTTEMNPKSSTATFNKIVDKLKENLNNLETNSETHTKTVKQFGNGFIEISKIRRDESSDDGILRKNSLHPLKMREVSDFDDVVDDSDERYQSRQLKFIDDDMMQNLYEDDDDKQTGEYPRSRRDFLTAIGMDNEDDYAADNAYKKSLEINNTDVKNDTRIHNKTEASNKKCQGNFGLEFDNSTASTYSHQKEDVNDIKQILEEPKELSPDNTIGNFGNNSFNTSKIEIKRAKTQQSFKHHKKMKAKKHKKHSRRTRYSDYNYDNNKYEAEKRNQRETSDDDEDARAKILQNRDRILNYQVAKNNNARFQRHQPRWSPSEHLKPKIHLKKSVKVHNLIKKEDNEEPPTENSATSAETEESSNAGAVETSTPEAAADSESTESSESTETSTETSKLENEFKEPPESSVDEAYEKMAHQMDLENEKLAQVVNGHHASQIVTDVIAQLKKKTNLKNKFLSGLSRKHANYAGNIDFDVFKSNETEDVGEAKFLLGQITKVLNRLVVNQVRRRMCQRIPEELRDYLNKVLNAKNPIEVNNFTPNKHQGNFLFKYQPETLQPPFDIKKLQETLVNLEGLLLSYHNMHQDCKSKAEPVKEYIEKHVKMLRDIVSCPSNTCNRGTPKGSESKRDLLGSSAFQSDLIEKQLESVGLGRNHDFVPNFDINQLVRSKLKSNSKRDTHKHNNNYKSEKYKKLQLAAERIREKRENERRIGELFGAKTKRSADEFDVDYEEPVVYRLG